MLALAHLTFLLCIASILAGASPINDQLEPQLGDDDYVATYYSDTGCNNGVFSVKKKTLKAFRNCYTTVPDQGLKGVKFHTSGKIFDNNGCSGGGNGGELESCVTLGGNLVRGLRIDNL